jgi:hypothetical protein
MITEKKFIELMTKFKQLSEDEDNMHNAMRRLDPDFGGFNLSRYSDILLELLKLLVNDEADWISWYVYEKNWGKEKKLTCYDKNNKKLPSNTLKDLYNLITKR